MGIVIRSFDLDEFNMEILGKILVVLVWGDDDDRTKYKGNLGFRIKKELKTFRGVVARTEFKSC